MSRTVYIESRGLKAVSRFAAKKDIRYYLQGVKVEARHDRTIVIGCDGHRLAAHCGTVAQSNDMPEGETAEFILPAEVVAAALKASNLRNNTLLRVEILDGEEKPSYRASTGPVTIDFSPIEGIFPDWRRVIPRGCTDDARAPQINAAYVGSFADAARDLGQKEGDVRLFYQPQPKGAEYYAPAALVRIDGAESFVGVVMPVRTGEELEQLRQVPAWA